MSNNIKNNETITIDSMVKYKVIYFETTGIVEVIRLILVHANQPFEDVRIPIEEWNEFKKSLLFERLPIVEINGEAYHQSLAIARYLARQYKLAGNNDKENLEIDAIVDTINDMRVCFTACLWEQNHEEKARKVQDLLKNKIPFYLVKFETIINENGGYLWRNKLTWADLLFLGLLPYMNLCVDKDILEGYPNLQEYVKKISDIPRIREWLKKRPTMCCLRELLKKSQNNVIITSE